MKNEIRILIIFALLLSAFYSRGQSRYFMKIEGPNLNGNSQIAPHVNEFELEAFIFGTTNSGTNHISGGGGGASGKPSLLPFSVTLKQSKNLNTVYQAIHDGVEFTKVTISVVKTFDSSSLEDYLVFTLEDVNCTAMTNAAFSNDDAIITNLELFSKIIKVEHYLAQPTGGRNITALETEWDIPKNMAP